MSVVFSQFNPSNYVNALFITDQTVAGLKCFPKECTFVLPCGEIAKDLSYVTQIYDFLLHNGANRSSIIVAVGGGSVCDLAGFICATYMRGCSLILVPTTLLAQIDACIGGKNAIDYGGIKNLIGTFYMPQTTVIDVDFLSTLSTEQINEGYAEIIKYSCFCEKIDRFLTQKVGKIDQELISACIEYKSEIVEKDFFDNGERHILNAGHTLGHAFESYYKLSHGKSVGCGLYYELQISYQFGLISKEFLDAKCAQLLSLFDIPRGISVDFAQLVSFAVHDKKNVSGILLMLATGDHRCLPRTFSPEQLLEVLCNLR